MILLSLLDGEVRDVTDCWSVTDLYADYERYTPSLRADLRRFFFIATPWGIMPLR
jgi:hypothetical protein